ncbi:uncharacterized protein ATC70_011070 [Mucor velutinosus]|uniref:SWI/SNF and RSC complexes subunit Ssr4 C-terminal domain-containing protein n=1 Tax=Mucor velutinosus TaxID=708070 RepID=A0AAN7DFD3_9FUNG|nr:hypothetical protein ATC70_011070 [Mucor velutinosus]
MASAYYYNQQQAGGAPPSSMNQQQPPRGIPGQIGINPTPQHYLQQQQQQQQYRNQALNDSHRKRSQAKSSRQSAAMADDADEPSGDELDDISARDIAMARYKRNHDYLSEIFTPYNAASIVPPPLDINQTKEEIQKQIEEFKVKTSRQKEERDKKMLRLEEEQQKFWTLMNKLNESNTLESINEAANTLAEELGLRIDHSSQNVKAMAIPGIEEDLPAQPQQQQILNQQQPSQSSPQQQQQIEESSADNKDSLQDHSMMDVDNQNNSSTTNLDENNQHSKQQEDDNMDMYFKDGEEEEGATDSFFNEMVNADDDPSVSEFLNTE